MDQSTYIVTWTEMSQSLKLQDKMKLFVTKQRAVNAAKQIKKVNKTVKLYKMEEVKRW